MAIFVERRKGWLVIAVFLAISVGTGLSEIHRAKSLNAKPRPHHHSQYQYPLWPPHYGKLLALQPLRGYDPNQTVFPWLHEVVWGHETQTWLFSIISACLVGLSGIFPLIIIPLEAGKSLRNGAASDRLKLLLSFAVGGLLGDVFLHLLPEAWAHLHKLGGEQKGHLQIGLWLLTGLLSFFVIQKIFPESEDDGDEEEEEEVKDEAKQLAPLTNKKSEPDQSLDPLTSVLTPKQGNATKKNKAAKKRARNGHVRVSGPEIKKIQADNKQDRNVKILADDKQDVGQFSGKQLNRWVDSVKLWLLGEKQEDSPQNSKIKTSGWLNLVANMIDNFTHGLAVAGSYSVSTKTGLLTTFAILLHEIPHEIGDFAILLKAGFDRWKAAKAQLLTASGGMIGALIALAAESTKEAGDSTAWILPFTAGGFIYIALVTVMPDLLKETNPSKSFKQLMSLCAGITTMGLVTLLVD